MFEKLNECSRHRSPPRRYVSFAGRTAVYDGQCLLSLYRTCHNLARSECMFDVHREDPLRPSRSKTKTDSWPVQLARCSRLQTVTPLEKSLA